MKKLFLLAASLLLTHYAFADTNPNQFGLTTHSEYETIVLNNNEKVVPKKQHEEDPTLHFIIDANYPQIAGNNLSLATQEFNLRISQMVVNEIEQFKESVKRDNPHMQTLPEEVKHNTFKIDYDLDVIQRLSLISVRLTLEGFQAGRAHPYRSHRVFNFDLINNKELALSDLFKPKTKYLQVLAKYSHKKLHETVHDNDKWMITEGAKPLAKNYKNWNIEDDAILITFDEYQVAPYVYGSQEVEIPFSELENLLSPRAQIIASSKNPKHIG